MAMLGTGPISPESAEFAGYPTSPESGSGSITDSGTNVSMSGMGGLFSALGSAFSDAYRAVNPVVTPKPGDLVIDPRTGAYVSPAALQTAGVASALNPLLLLAVGGVIIFLVFRERK